MIGVAVREDRDRGTASRAPSTIDAWLSSSETMSAASMTESREHAEVRGEPGGKDDRLSCAFHPASSASSSWCTGREPVTSRDAPEPAPHRSSASCAASTTTGWVVRPR